MRSPVHFIGVSEGDSVETISDKAATLFDAAGLRGLFDPEDFVAIKVHFGEEGNPNFLRPSMFGGLVDRVRGIGCRAFWTDTNTLYTGERSNAVEHMLLAHRHGFTIDATGLPVIIADGLTGREEVIEEIPGRHAQKVGIASAVAVANGLLVITHATGHLVAGFGGAIKNLGMGLSARKGKLAQHSVVKPRISPKRCKGDGACLRWCPVQAIRLVDGKAFIDAGACIGCGECLAACRPGAVGFQWKMASPALQERMAEQAAGVLKSKQGKVGFVTFVVDVGKDCDCMPQRRSDVILKAVGILAGTDMVAMDQAALDLLDRHLPGGLRAHSHDLDATPQIRYAEELGLGSRDYEMIEV